MRTPEESRELFLRQLEKCVKLQNPSIPLPSPPSHVDFYVTTSEYLREEEMGNGEDVETTIDISDICAEGTRQVFPYTDTWA